MKSVYTYRHNDLNLQISFEIDEKEEINEIRDRVAIDFLDELLNEKFDADDFYLDDVVDMEE